MLRVIVSKKPLQVLSSVYKVSHVCKSKSRSCQQRLRCSKAGEKKPDVQKAPTDKVSENKLAQDLSSKSAENVATPPPPRKARWGLRLMFFGVGFVGGTVGLCYTNPNIRRLIEETIPYSDTILLELFGPINNGNSKINPSLTGSHSLPIDYPSGSSSKIDTGAKPDMKKVESESKSKAETEKEAIERKITEQKQESETQNKALQLSLEPLVSEVSSRVTAAVEAQKSAAQAVLEHVDKVRAVMDTDDIQASGDTGGWQEVGQLLDAKKSAVSAAESAYTEAKQGLDKLQSVIERGKSNEITRKNSQLRKAESTHSDLLYQVNRAQTKLSSAQSELRVAREYRRLVDDGRQQLKKEMESVLGPDVRIGGTKHDMSVDELNSMIAFAHRRLGQLQRHLAHQQASEQLRYQRMLEAQRVEGEKLTQARVEQEMERLRQEHKADVEKVLLEARAQFEVDIRDQLRRQAAAHSDHLIDVLNVQYKEQEAMLRAEYSELVSHEQEKMREELTRALARLRGIEHAVDVRAESEREGLRAQELWLACQAFLSAATYGDPHHDGGAWEDRLKPLADKVSGIHAVSGSDQFVQTLVGTLPPVALSRGVYTEEALCARFHQVSSRCRRVALVDERGGSLLSYFLSYLQSLVMLERAFPPLDTLPAAGAADTSLTTHHILYYSRQALDEGDLDRAARLINQLTGEPRRVAGYWLGEARLLLEVRQLARMLAAHAAATHVTAVERIQ